MRFTWLWALSLLVLAITTRADETVVPRYIEFRDGSVLRLPVIDETWKIITIKADGTTVEDHLPLSSLQSFTLTPGQGFARKQALLAAVRRLGSDDFREREKAHAELLKLGPDIRPDLETCLQFTRDVETKVRLEAILAGWPRKGGTPVPGNAVFDLFTVKEQVWGHLGDEGIPVLVAGQKRRLMRQDVQRVSVASPMGTMVMSPGNAESTFRRLGAGEFPSGCIEESFETDPDGNLLKIGGNIEKSFLKKGFVLSTSIAQSYVSVNNFAVTGKSRGLSAATNRPLWEGEITIRFVQPGREGVPAGVTHFGCWIAAVLPRGTALVAYDRHGRELAKIETQSNGTDFLGLHSTTPMHRLKIVPNVTIDRDYTLDDFIFTPPILYETTPGDKFTVHLVEGDRVFCPDVGFDKEGVKLYGLPAGLPDLTVPHGRLLRMHVPENRKPAPLPAGVFAQLRDGSVLFGPLPQGKNGPPHFARRPQLLQERDLFAGLWGSNQPRQIPSAPGNGIQYFWRSTQEWANYNRIEFQEESILLADMTSKLVVDYKDMSSLWLTPPPSQPPVGSLHVRTRQGDDLIVAQPTHIRGKLSQEMVLLWQGQTVRLSPETVTGIYQVGDRNNK